MNAYSLYIKPGIRKVPKLWRSIFLWNFEWSPRRPTSCERYCSPLSKTLFQWGSAICWVNCLWEANGIFRWNFKWNFTLKIFHIRMAFQSFRRKVKVLKMQPVMIRGFTAITVAFTHHHFDIYCQNYFQSFSHGFEVLNFDLGKPIKAAYLPSML